MQYMAPSLKKLFVTLRWARRVALVIHYGHIIVLNPQVPKLPRDPLNTRNLIGDQDLLSELSAWLDSDTLVIHLMLIHEGLGLICLDTSGIQYTQWFLGLPGFGSWDAQRLTSVIFTIVENGKNPHRLETKLEERNMSWLGSWVLA
jgi:hypothetical protein